MEDTKKLEALQALLRDANGLKDEEQRLLRTLAKRLRTAKEERGIWKLLLKKSEYELLTLVTQADGCDSLPPTFCSGLTLPRSAWMRLRQIDMALGEKQYVEETAMRWRGYVTQLQALKKKPTAFPKDAGDRLVYQQFRQVFRTHHFSEDFLPALLAPMMQFLRTGQVEKAILLVGSPGCGKSTAGGKLLSEALGLPLCRINAAQAEHAHGLTGEGDSFKSNDCGALVKGLLNSAALNPVFLIDEVDKAPTKLESRVSLQDELVEILDPSIMAVNDAALGFAIPISGPVVLTANDSTAISKPLLDRCTVISFPDVKLENMVEIIREYTQEKLRSCYPGCLDLDPEQLDRAVISLYRNNHSIRQFQSLVDGVLNTAYQTFLSGDTDNSVSVTGEMFHRQLQLQTRAGQMQKIGFA